MATNYKWYIGLYPAAMVVFLILLHVPVIRFGVSRAPISGYGKYFFILLIEFIFLRGFFSVLDPYLTTKKKISLFLSPRMIPYYLLFFWAVFVFSRIPIALFIFGYFYLAVLGCFQINKLILEKADK